MPTEQVQKIVKHHRPALYIGTLAGLVLIGSIVTYQIAATPATPIVQRATTAEIVDYVSNKRGLAKLPEIQQKQFLEEWQRRLTKPADRDELKQHLTAMPEDKRETFVNAILLQFKRSFLDDAKKFAQLHTPGEKNEFCRQKLGEGRDQAMQFKDIALGLKAGGGKRTDDIQQWVLENTTAEERAIGEPYFDALKRVREQVKKEERGSATTQAKGR